MTRGAIVPQGGVKPFIHPVLVHGRNAEEQSEAVPPTVEQPPTAHSKEDWYGDGGP